VTFSSSSVIFTFFIGCSWLRGEPAHLQSNPDIECKEAPGPERFNAQTANARTRGSSIHRSR
jgi:hypothetical protein